MEKTFIKELPAFTTVEHKIDNNGKLVLLNQRIEDGYINATELCKLAKKPFGHYNERRETKEFLEVLSSDIGIPISELVIVIKGGIPHLQGTWVHPQVAINLAQWLSPRFASAISKLVFEWASGKLKAKLPYHLERYIINAPNIPQTKFSMLNEMTINLIAPLEYQGYRLPEKLIPDMSEGGMFCDWLRREKNINTDNFPTYPHKYQDGRVVQAKLYPIELLPDFRKHFYEVWLKTRAVDYFSERDKNAVPYVEKVIELVGDIEINPTKLENKNKTIAKTKYIKVEKVKWNNPNNETLESVMAIGTQNEVDYIGGKKPISEEEDIINKLTDAKLDTENNSFKDTLEKVVFKAKK